MEKTFLNSAGQRLTFTDEGIHLKSRGKFFPYEQIDSFGLGAMGIFTVNFEGVTYTFVANIDDKAELKAVVKSLKETQKKAISPERTETAKKDLFTDWLTEVFIAVLVIGLFALLCYALPYLKGTLSFILNLVVGIVLFAALLLLIVFFVSFLRKTVHQELKGTKIFYNILQILTFVLCLFVSGLMVFHFIAQMDVGYHSGIYSSFNCADCGEPADGGMWNGGYFGEDDYYCKQHFERRKEIYEMYRDKKAGEDDFGHDEYDAWTAAKDIVKDKLKSPSTAEFCKASETTITRNGNTWTIQGYVDAQNSFGATLRNEFTVVITFTNATKYTIDSCVIKAK